MENVLALQELPSETAPEERGGGGGTSVLSVTLCLSPETEPE
jgi:SapB morphogen precursor RamS